LTSLAFGSLRAPAFAGAGRYSERPAVDFARLRLAARARLRGRWPMLRTIRWLWLRSASPRCARSLRDRLRGYS